jgi:hypothetical protein
MSETNGSNKKSRLDRLEDVVRMVVQDQQWLHAEQKRLLTAQVLMVDAQNKMHVAVTKLADVQINILVRIDALAANTAARINAVEDRMAALEDRMTGLDSRMTALDSRMGDFQIEERKRGKELDKRIAALVSAIGELTRRQAKPPASQ